MPFDPTPTVGEADQFLSVIEKQAIPLIEREYRVDSQHRILVGGSLGGLFTLYALFTRPELFQGYVAASPSVIFAWPYEEEFARSKQTINAPVFMSVGGMESAAYQNDIMLLHERLASRDYLKGGYEFARFEAMRHDGAIYQAFAEGLQSVAKSIAPERGIEGAIAPQLAANYYVIHFNRTAALPPEAQWTRAQRTAIQRHRRLLDEMMKEKKIFLTARTPDGNALMFSTIGLNAHDKAEAERTAAADPAVMAGLLSFDVMNLTEQRRTP